MLPELHSLSAVAAAEVDGTTTITGEQLSISARNGSQIDLDVDVDSIGIEVMGGADIDLTGSATTANLRVIGGADFSGGDFAAQDANVEISGGAEAFLTVTNSITGTVSGGSELGYLGMPETATVTASGGSEIVGM